MQGKKCKLHDIIIKLKLVRKKPVTSSRNVSFLDSGPPTKTLISRSKDKRLCARWQTSNNFRHEWGNKKDKWDKMGVPCVALCILSVPCMTLCLVSQFLLFSLCIFTLWNFWPCFLEWCISCPCHVPGIAVRMAETKGS